MAKPLLDHIVILVAPTTLRQLQHALKDSLLVAPGGTHADGLTENRLILLPDGVYIELIAFVDGVDPDSRKRHRWGQLPENTIIDWALTLPHESDFAAVRARVDAADTPYAYSDPVPGGRVTDDKTVLKWAVATAVDGTGGPLRPGLLPFWCLDRTPRRLRVPYEGSDYTKHPSGVTGVAKVQVAEGGDLAGVYQAILGDGDKWHVDVPSGTGGHVVLGGKEMAIALKGKGGRIHIVPGVVLEVIDEESP